MPVTVTSHTVRINNKRVVRVRVVETGSRDTTEWSTVGIDIPPAGSVVHYQAQRTAGTGATIQPRLGKQPSWSDSTIDAIFGVAAAAAYINEGTPAPFTFPPGSTPIIYGRSTPPSSATDHAIVTNFTIVEAG